LYQQQSSYDLNQFLIDNSAASYGVDNFDLSLLSSDYAFDNYQATQIKLENGVDSNLALSIEIDNCYQYPTQNQLKQEDNTDWQQQYYLHTSSLLSPISPATTAHSSPSPCPSVEYHTTIIKQEQNILLPPSPPDSNGVPSPQSAHCESFKIELQDIDEQSFSNSTILSPNCAENTIDIKYLLDSREQKQQDHQVLREFLQDTTFQRKHNLKPLALESLFGGLTQQGDIEPVISLALQHAKQEVQATCNALNISPDPQQWSEQQVQLWISTTIKQFKLEPISKCDLLFPENGQLFAMLSDEDFTQRVPQVTSNVSRDASLV
jgi:SAM pointed domain-containing ETS transcription factor